MNMSAQNMVLQVESLPELIRSEFRELDRRVRLLLDHNEWLSVKKVLLTGCGDSYMAGVAAELTFEEVAAVPTEALNAMQAGRYAAPNFDHMFPRNPLVVGVSVSGTVARTREALLLARKHGALTVAATGNPDSPLAQVAEKVLGCVVPEFAPAPGIRSYRISLLALNLIAIRIAEIRGRLSQEAANALRERLKRTADAIEATIAAVREPAQRLAEATAKHRHFVFVGDGPNYATALFSAAKLMEAAGRHADGQDTEEWAHLQYFVSEDPQTPTFFISPGGRGHVRAAELLEPARRIGRTIVAVVPQGDTVIAPGADWVLPVVGDVDEVFSPMVYAVAGELYSAYLAEALGEPPFRAFNGVYADGGNTIKTSAVIESL
jgi:glucosamine--fructose-6-phosphate aminotransferase (isomerizing)